MIRAADRGDVLAVGCEGEILHACAWPVKAPIGSPVATSQTRTVRSSPPEAIARPSRENVTALAPPGCPGILRTVLSRATSQSRIVPSSPDGGQ